MDRHAAGGAAVYGINTGFGALADVAIPADQLSALQLNLLRSHAAGVGEPLPVPVVRALLALRANVLAKGYSGIRVETVEALIALLNARVHPRVPARGSVGASGDLAPLAHLALVLVGEGDTLDGRSGADALARPACGRSSLAPKEGLALINGTQASTALLALAVLATTRLARVADIAAALSIDALRGSFHPFEARIHDARPVPGQAASAANLRQLGTGQRDQRVARQLRQGPGRLRAALRAAGARRRARSPRLRPPARRDRNQRRHGQPDGLRRRRATSSPAGISTARPSRSPPTRWRSASHSSRPSASAAPTG